MIRKDELSFVGGPAEWIIAKQREDARRVATAQRRNGYKTGYAPACAFLTPCLPRAVGQSQPSLRPSLCPLAPTLTPTPTPTLTTTP